MIWVKISIKNVLCRVAAGQNSEGGRSTPIELSSECIAERKFQSALPIGDIQTGNAQ
jgi:hypothetical protein